MGHEARHQPCQDTQHHHPYQVPQGALLPPPQSPNTSQLGWGPWFILVPPPPWLVLAVGRSLCVPSAH